MSFQNLSLFAFLFMLASCTNSYHVQSDFIPEQDFTHIRTFSILDNDHGFGPVADPINMQRIEMAIIREMKAMDYNQSTEPDVELLWYIKIDRVAEPFYYRDQYDRWEDPVHMEVNTYSKGTLVVDIIDCQANKVIWHGKTSDRVYDDMKNLQEKIDAVVREIFVKYRKDIGVMTKK